MDSFKKTSLYILVFLILLSIYKDLTIGSLVVNESHSEVNTPINSIETDIKTTKIKIQPGDTVLSVIERVNHDDLNHLDIQKVVDDFKQLNPLVNPYDLEVNQYYYFPVY